MHSISAPNHESNNLSRSFTYNSLIYIFEVIVRNQMHSEVDGNR